MSYINISKDDYSLGKVEKEYERVSIILKMVKLSLSKIETARVIPIMDNDLKMALDHLEDTLKDTLTLNEIALGDLAILRLTLSNKKNTLT